MQVDKKLCAFGFTVARYQRVGSVSLLSVLGLDVYQ